MANFKYHLSCVDGYGRKYQRSGIVTGVDQPTAKTNLATFVNHLEAVMAGSVQKYTVSEEVAGADSPAAGANRDEGVSLQLDLGAGKTHTFSIGAPDKAFVGTDGTVDLTQTEYVNLVADFTGGFILVSDGETATGAIKASLDV